MLRAELILDKGSRTFEMKIGELGMNESDRPVITASAVRELGGHDIIGSRQE